MCSAEGYTRRCGVVPGMCVQSEASQAGHKQEPASAVAVQPEKLCGTASGDSIAGYGVLDQHVVA